jgi:transcription initiation factor TFIID subunit TAF12
MSTKRQTMQDLEKKAVETRDKEAKATKKEIAKGVKISGFNRKKIRALIKRQKPQIKVQQKREAYKAKKIAATLREQGEREEKAGENFIEGGLLSMAESIEQRR